MSQVAPDADVEPWPDHVVPHRLFCAVATQWRMGAAGPIGLDYSVLPIVGRSLGLSSDEVDEVLVDLQVMECAALELFAERRAELDRASGRT